MDNINTDPLYKIVFFILSFLSPACTSQKDNPAPTEDTITIVNIRPDELTPLLIEEFESNDAIYLAADPHEIPTILDKFPDYSVEEISDENEYFVTNIIILDSRDQPQLALLNQPKKRPNSKPVNESEEGGDIGPKNWSQSVATKMVQKGGVLPQNSRMKTTTIPMRDIPLIDDTEIVRSDAHKPVGKLGLLTRILHSPYTLKETLMYVLQRKFAKVSPRTSSQLPFSDTNIARPAKNRKMINPPKIVFLGDLIPPSTGSIQSVDPALKLAMKKADHVFINLEAGVSESANPIADPKSNKLAWTPAKLKETIEMYGLPMDKVVFSVANNHAYDFGEERFLETVTELRKMGATVIGHKDNPEDSGIHIFEVQRDGETYRFGVAAHSEILNPHQGQAVGERLQGPQDSARLQRTDFSKLKQQHKLDSFILMPHWGRENVTRLDSGSRQMAENFSKHGVDIILGTGPHVLHRPEVLGKNTFMISSIGNATSLRQTPLQSIGVATTIELNGDSFAYHPIFTHQTEDGKIVPLAEAPDSIRDIAQKYYDIGR